MFDDLNLVIDFLFDTLEQIASLVTGNSLLAFAIGLFVFSRVVNFFRRLYGH